MTKVRASGGGVAALRQQRSTRSIPTTSRSERDNDKRKLDIARHFKSMSTYSQIKTTFHILSLGLLTYPYWWIHSNPTRVNDAYGWHFQMLTILTLTVAYVQFWVALISDFAPKSDLVRNAKRILLLIACPCETLVSVLYWPIKLYDASLLAPPELLALFPLSADMSMHAMPAILLLIETFAFSEAIETSNLRAATAYGLYAVGYYFWTERNARLNGWYPYPM